MVMFPNDGISYGNGSKRPLENGFLSPSSGDAPKFKVRKVSATRQYPDMCGPEFQHFSVEPEETVAVTGVGCVGLKLDSNGGVTTGTGLQNPPCVDKKGYLGEETDGAGTFTGLGLQEKADLLCCETLGKGCEANGTPILPLEAWQNHLAMKANESEKLMNAGGWQNVFNDDGAAVGLEIPDIEMEIEVEAQSHEVVGSAVLEEGNESVDMLMELVDEGSNQVLSDITYVETESVKGHERKGMNMKLPKEVQPSAGKSGHGEVESLAKRADEGGVKSYSEGGSLIHEEGSAVSTKHKFSRKRVPAKRDFPKYYGLNALAPPAEDQNVASEKFSQGVNKVSKENALEVLDTKAEKASSEKLGTRVEVGDGVSVVSKNVRENGTEDRENDHVIDTSARDNVIGSGQEGDHVIVNALVAAKNCPWRQHKVTAASGGSVAGDSANRVKPGWRGKAVVKKTISNANAQRLLLKKMSASTSKHKLVYMFKLKRVPSQPEVAWKEFKASKKARVRHGVCVDDISGRKELYPIGAVNTIDDEKPPPFTYIKKVIYPKSLHLHPAKGCTCSGKCSSSRKCSCALRNGGEIPYNRNGAIVEIKSILYECGPHCKCPPSCYNRVSQSGIKLPLEIFKTESRGWGVRALSSISSGSFICEYAGEILDDKEAEKRTSDEYLFDIGQIYSDSDADADTGGEGSYTIDALRYGNVGRFINHSCSPNLYAQNVIYDHDDKRVPHIMLFAAENIPPLQELTYDYNYVVGQVHDSNGNVKVKNCYCGTTGCTGRMY